jgi:hypothetical protein
MTDIENFFVTHKVIVPDKVQSASKEESQSRTMEVARQRECYQKVTFILLSKPFVNRLMKFERTHSGSNLILLSRGGKLLTCR